MVDAAQEIKTIFCDIDGCVFKHFTNICDLNKLNTFQDVLPGVKKAFADWRRKGYRIILTTGRPHGAFDITHQQLTKCGLFYDDIIMGLPRGMRVIINDIKPDSEIPTASGLNLNRDEGMSDVDI